MASLPQKIPIIPQQVLASYDYTDISENTGTVMYYGTATASPSVAYVLTRQIIASKDITVKNVNKTFTLSEFKLPATMKGTAYVVGGMEVTDSTGSALTFSFRKGGVEFATVTTPVYAVGDAHQWISLNVVIPDTHFAKGDVFSVVVSWSVASTDRYFGADPLDRDGESLAPSVDDITTQLVFYIPYDLNLQ